MRSPVKGSTACILTAVFVTGASVMMLEVLGTRVVGPYYGVGLYVWSALISVTLGFLAIGYYLGGRFSDRKPSITILNWILFTAGVIILTLPLLHLPVVKACRVLGLRLGSLMSSVILFGPPMILLGAMCIFGFFVRENPGEVLSPELIHQTQSLYGDLKVVETANERMLLIDGIVHTAIPKREDVVCEKRCALTQKYYLELLPYYNPYARNALLVGLGGGLIQKILCSYGIEVKSVEIDAKVVDIARRFFGFKGEVWIGDGRYYVQNVDEKYGFVILDAYASDTVPFHMFTKEMFESIRDILEERGILAINYVGFPKKTITKSLYKTLKSVFPHVHVYRSEEGDGIQIMYFFASPSDLTLEMSSWGTGQGKKQLTISLNRDCVFYEGDDGIIITDDFNPVEFWWVETGSAWRNKTEDVLSCKL